MRMLETTCTLPGDISGAHVDHAYKTKQNMYIQRKPGEIRTMLCSHNYTFSNYSIIIYALRIDNTKMMVNCALAHLGRPHS